MFIQFCCTHYYIVCFHYNVIITYYYVFETGQLADVAVNFTQGKAIQFKQTRVFAAKNDIALQDIVSTKRIGGKGGAHLAADSKSLLSSTPSPPVSPPPLRQRTAASSAAAEDRRQDGGWRRQPAVGGRSSGRGQQLQRSLLLPAAACAAPRQQPVLLPTACSVLQHLPACRQWPRPEARRESVCT